MSNSLQPYGLYSPWTSSGQSTGVGSLSFLQGISPIQGSNPGLPHCGQILYQLSHKGSPRGNEGLGNTSFQWLSVVVQGTYHQVTLLHLVSKLCDTL